MALDAQKMEVLIKIKNWKLKIKDLSDEMKADYKIVPQSGISLWLTRLKE
jgi:hypothetical protein